jgi:hypothetical protein
MRAGDFVDICAPDKSLLFVGEVVGTMPSSGGLTVQIAGVRGIHVFMRDVNNLWGLWGCRIGDWPYGPVLILPEGEGVAPVVVVPEVKR